VEEGLLEEKLEAVDRTLSKTLGPITHNTQKHGKPSRPTKLQTNSGESPISGTTAWASNKAASAMKQRLVIMVTDNTRNFCLRTAVAILLE